MLVSALQFGFLPRLGGHGSLAPPFPTKSTLLSAVLILFPGTVPWASLLLFSSSTAPSKGVGHASRWAWWRAGRAHPELTGS